MAARVLVAEPLAESGLEAMRSAGLEVEVKTGLTSEELCAALPGVSALVIRSATQVTAEVLAAATDLIVVGRAGIGLDNADVAEATKRGVMVVNAPQSNILSAAEHTMALLLSQARNVPQANADLKTGAWNRSKWEGGEWPARRLESAGFGAAGGLVASARTRSGCASSPTTRSSAPIGRVSSACRSRRRWTSSCRYRTSSRF